MQFPPQEQEQEQEEEDYSSCFQNNTNLDLSSTAHHPMEIINPNFNSPHDFSSSNNINIPLLPFTSSSSTLQESSYSSPDFLTLYHLSNYSNSMQPDPVAASIISDPIFNPQPPFLPEFFNSQNPSLDLQFHPHPDDHHHHHHGLNDFNFNLGNCLGKRFRKPPPPPPAPRVTKQYVNDRQKRVHVKDTFQTLKDLVPYPTKKDRASIVGDAIRYIKELTLSVNELKMLVEKKRSRSGLLCGNKRVKTDEDEEVDEEDDSMENTKPQSLNGNGSLRSSWIQRKSKDSEVDVRIIDDEVTIKVVQRKRINRLLYVSKVIDQLHLDLHHLAGGHVGDYYSFLFNAKINEGSCVYASAIANRIMEAVEGSRS
ncbi:basic helix-loop-helix (bHLH) DNA-binding superfamily protein [Euphorbia peplus]|nr:basic helix-loop-helix (bHLH) DNA-binding superfamily protein [Euphorbia peplus]